LTWRGERFQVWVTNPETVQQILDLQQGKSDAAIPSGRILRAPGEGAHNVRWSWHLDPEDIQMSEFTVEVCDATPSFVESEMDYFVDTVQRYRPWSAKPLGIQDHRWPRAASRRLTPCKHGREAS